MLVFFSEISQKSHWQLWVLADAFNAAKHVKATTWISQGLFRARSDDSTLGTSVLSENSGGFPNLDNVPFKLAACGSTGATFQPARICHLCVCMCGGGHPQYDSRKSFQEEPPRYSISKNSPVHTALNPLDFFWVGGSG